MDRSVEARLVFRYEISYLFSFLLKLRKHMYLDGLPKSFAILLLELGHHLY